MINENTKRVKFPNPLLVSTKLDWLISGIKRIGDPWVQAAQVHVSPSRQEICFVFVSV